MARYFDTHAHYDEKRYADDRHELLGSLPERGVELVLVPGCHMKSSRASIALSEKYAFIYSAVGVHPHDSSSLRNGDIEELKKLSNHPKVMAIGEIGLDYHYDFSPREAQRACFEKQLALAQELQMPVIVHDREAHEDTLNILRGYQLKDVVYHCYSGSLEHAKSLLNLGYYLGFTGAVTFKGARHALETLQYMPLDRILLETDAPYLAPEPHRGERNDSTYLPFVAEAAARARNTTVEEIAEAAFQNGKRFFGISL